MTYVICWDNDPRPEIMQEPCWSLFGETILSDPHVMAVHVYGEDGKWDCDVNLTARRK